MSGTATVNQTVGCRDDIMLYLISRGMDAKLSFKIMESVRKGKVKRGGFQDGWVETMQEHGVPEWYITSLSKIAYLFPKAHAVAYVMMRFASRGSRCTSRWRFTAHISIAAARRIRSTPT